MGKTAVVVIFLISLGNLWGICWAHIPPGVTYLAFQWPEEFEPMIDGDLSEWEIVPDEYVQTTEDFFEKVSHSAIDTSDFAILRSIVGWNDKGNRLYFAAEIFDNEHKVNRQRTHEMFRDDYFLIMLDADHSGGQYSGWERTEDFAPDEWYKDRTGFQAAKYFMSVPAPDGVPFWIEKARAWAQASPWAEYSWRIEGDLRGESTTFYEVSIMPFDGLSWRGPDQSLKHDLEEGGIIGLTYAFLDFDYNRSGGRYWSLSNAKYDLDYAEFTDFLLSPIINIFKATVIEENTWGRIKASMSKK